MTQGTLWSLVFLSVGHAATERHSTRAQVGIATPVSASFAGRSDLAGTTDVATVSRPTGPGLFDGEMSFLQADAGTAGHVPAAVESITVAGTTVSAHQPIGARTLAPAGATTTVNLASHFTIPTVVGPIVEFDTVVGKFAVELYGDDAPLNVANFLRHVNAGSYTNTFIHRSVPDFVIQGGGYRAEFDLPAVTRLGTAPLEYAVPNHRGTLAVARGSDPDSGGSQWYINTIDNADILQPSGVGREGYTVIGRVLGAGLEVVDTLAGLPVYYLSDFFSELPLYNYVTGTPLTFDHLVNVRGIAEVPMFPSVEAPRALVAFSVTNSNEAVVRAALSGSLLTLTSVGEGTAQITVRATESAGDWAEQHIAVTVSGIAPAIVQHPVSQVLVKGQGVVLAVQASGSAPLTYRWMKDGDPIPESGAVSGVHTDSLSVYAVTAESTGRYSVSVTNSTGTVTSDAAELTVVDQLMTQGTRGNGYLPGGVVEMDGKVMVSGEPSSVTWSVLLPEGWAFHAAGGPEYASRPTAGDVGLLEFTWTPLPSAAFSFWYFLKVPAEATGDVSFTSMVTMVREEEIKVLATPDPLVISRSIHHTADTDGDFRLGLSELLRVIELYNTRDGTLRTGGYRDISGSVDDFAPDPRSADSTIKLLRYHSADTDQDARLSLSELLRVIELYNTRQGSVRTGQYRKGDGTVDGFMADV